MESNIESAENKIRLLHNDLESKKIFGKKHYFAYDNEKFLNMIGMFYAVLHS